MAARANCWKSIAEKDRPCAFESPRVARSRENTTLSSLSLTLLGSRSNCDRSSNVFTSLQIGCFAPAALLGRLLSPAPLRADVCAQLLGRARRRGCSSMELGKLQNSFHKSALPPSAFPNHAHRRLRYPVLDPPGLSAGVFSFLPRGRA